MDKSKIDVKIERGRVCVSVYILHVFINVNVVRNFCPYYKSVETEKPHRPLNDDHEKKNYSKFLMIQRKIESFEFDVIIVLKSFYKLRNIC